MTPAARVAAAIEVLDLSLSGVPTEQVLTNWARGHRFAGSGDRAAIRDLVYDAIRCRRSFAALGGGLTGRGLMIGACRAAGDDPARVFTGAQYAPVPLTETEAGHAPIALTQLDRLDRLDCPDWIAPRLEAALGADFEPVMAMLRARAPVFLRVNTRRTDVADAVSSLAGDGIETRPHTLSPTALEVTGNARRLRNAAAFREGAVELQDAASQAVVDALPDLPPGARVLDFCAGGGGKSLALFVRFGTSLVAHDANARRMADLPARAARAGAEVTIVKEQRSLAPRSFDLVLCDVPCSGSGAWRRQPDAKWRFGEADLKDLIAVQTSVLRQAAGLVAPGGYLAYATCSLLDDENRIAVDTLLHGNRHWKLADRRGWLPTDGGDGFALSILTRG